MPDDAEGAAAPALPLLYRQLDVITAQQHGTLRLRRDIPVPGAAQLGALPLATEEIALVGRHLPVVFAADPPHLPVALLRLVDGGPSNACDEAGAWRAGRYVPAYLRRHPFLLVPQEGSKDQWLLCIDTSSPALSENLGSGDSGEPLYEVGPDGPVPGAVLQRALVLARDTEAALRRTKAFCAHLAALSLLTPTTARLTPTGGKKDLEITGFLAVDRVALARVGGEGLARLRDAGQLEAIYAHLASLDALGDLPAPITAG